MAVVLVVAAFAGAFIAAVVAFLLGSPVWLGIAAVIAVASLATTLTALWLMIRTARKKRQIEAEHLAHRMGETTQT